MAGFAVVDVETTGLYPGARDRIVEIAVVLVSESGTIQDSWYTLVNPQRDLGPQHIHGLSAADVRHAPTFDEIAGDLADLLGGRVFTAHNVSFDRRFVVAEFQTVGVHVPLDEQTCTCTMRMGRVLLPGSPRTLASCCDAASIALDAAHTAASDAMATAELLSLYVASTPDDTWKPMLAAASSALWPRVGGSRGKAPVHRGVASQMDQHFLARIAERLPLEADTWQEDEYLGALDRALMDRFLSAREHDALALLADESGIDRAAAHRLHVRYLGAMAQQALADGVLTDAERSDLEDVAKLLVLTADDVARALETVATETQTHGRGQSTQSAGGLTLGDMVVFTGQMTLPREEWERRAAAAGLKPRPSVTKKVKVVVAADPDSLSGKARKAADYGIPIVSEQGFARLMEGLSPS